VAATGAENFSYQLPAIREERRPGGLMVAYGVTLALVVGSAALAFGFLGHEERGATHRSQGANLPTPGMPMPATDRPAPEKSATSLKLPPRPQQTGPQVAAAPPQDPAKPPSSAGLAIDRPLIHSLPDPASPDRQNAAWRPLTPNGLPAPPPEKPNPPATYRSLPPVDGGEMIEVTSDGLRLPRVSPSGWMPWLAYARRYSKEGPQARVGLMMINVGANEPLMKRAVEQLPGEVSLAFLPGTPDLNRWMQRARDYGHEVYLMLPVEDPGGPAERGIRPIETSVDATENLKRLRAAMGKAEGYVGFVIPFPGPASQSEPTMRPVMKEISDRGLAVVEVNATQSAPTVYRLTVEMGVGYARNSSVLDYKANRQNIEENLERMVRWVAEQPGGQGKSARHAFGVVQPNQAAIDAIAEWAKKLAATPEVAFLPVIGHFECREACMMRVRRLQAQLRP
jgi:polysaccharide deacetylase 2 family uncharacterized protein YibQ